MPAAPPDIPAPLGRRAIARAWAPLAASWLMMSLELPALSAVVARLPEPRIHLAAFGGVVFPLALIIESPIIMMLAASTALSRDGASYHALRRFMMQLSAVLTALHVLLAFTPLYDVVAVHLIGAPAEVIEPARLGLRLMTPWTWAIADRRFHQGVLIRYGRSRLVGAGTLVRLLATVSALAAGALAGLRPGIAVATLALSVGVIVEAIFARIAVAPILRGPLAGARSRGAPLAFGALLAFYVPLAVTPLLGLLSQPVGSAAISRMPEALLCLAAWPALNGLVFLTRSLGIAFNEVVVSECERPGALAGLRRFAVLLTAATGVGLALVALTPLSEVWFARVCRLDPELAALAGRALPWALLLPGLTVWQSYWQGVLVHARRTRGIPESMALFLAFAGAILGAGVLWQGANGLVVTLVAFTVGLSVQAAWLAWRARPVLRELAAPHPAPTAADEAAAPVPAVIGAPEWE